MRGGGGTFANPENFRRSEWKSGRVEGLRLRIFHRRRESSGGVPRGGEPDRGGPRRHVRLAVPGYVLSSSAITVPCGIS